MPEILPLSKSSFGKVWSELRQKKFELALQCLIEGKTPKEAVLTRKGRGSRSFDYVTGSWIVQQLNDLFDFNWDWEIIQQEIGKGQIWVKGKLTVKILQESGQTVSITKTSFGGSDIKSYSEKAGQRGGEVMDIGDDLKAASTDALKKAASLLGIAADVYGGDDAQVGSKPTIDPNLIKALFFRGGNLGWNETQVRSWVQESMQVELDDLEGPQVQKLVTTLINLQKERVTSNGNTSRPDNEKVLTGDKASV